ncbi:hypothetical protein GMA12_04445 [Kocuria sediminis]|uniref:Uncharacterized protein n=1 Tax=Kocuria sediminis TaxID=1038857 RepID=A0A6N8GJG3_9MICC|nr:hypothetical protein [Kocuria sediminis]MUN62397.1 hypothetical protein [Kocuria sediminis]
MKTWKKSVLCSVAAGALMVGGLLSPVSAAPNPPGPDGGTFDFNCSNGAELTVTYEGKIKTIENASGTKTISPGTKATVTNITSGKSATYTITGTGRPEALGENTRVRLTGRNLVIRPFPNPDELYVTSGNVTYVVDAEGNEVKRFSGPGNVIDVCEELG